MWTEDKLDAFLTTPSDALISDMKRLNGDIMVLGAGGKWVRPLPARQTGGRKAGLHKRVLAVSRFTDPIATELLQRGSGVETIPCDSADLGALQKLPSVGNDLHGRQKIRHRWKRMADLGNERSASRICRHQFRESKIVAFSLRQHLSHRPAAYRRLHRGRPTRSGGGIRHELPCPRTRL